MNLKVILTSLAIVLIAAGIYVYKYSQDNHKASLVSKLAASNELTVKKNDVLAAKVTNNCDKNKLSQLVIVDISDRHMWACESGKQVYDTSVITGMEFLAADLTPTGTYAIYSKQTDQYLRGSDSTGSWNDYVYYWLPFLSNKYGIYGFHDATWRQDGDFGNISPSSKDASHGCVELPLAAAKWLYNWSHIGTTLTIQS